MGVDALNLKCIYAKLISLFAKRLIYGYKCNMQELYLNILKLRRYITIEENIIDCSLKGDIIDEINKFKRSLILTYGEICQCE